MDEVTIRIFERGQNRVLIVQRSDGRYTYRMQLRQADGWGAAGPDCGIYVSAEMAESEAHARVWWLRKPV